MSTITSMKRPEFGWIEADRKSLLAQARVASRVRAKKNLAFLLPAITKSVIIVGTLLGMSAIALSSIPHNQSAESTTTSTPIIETTVAVQIAPVVETGLTPASAKTWAHSQIANYGWDETQWQCLDRLWTQESGWQYDVGNPESGAWGIPQSWPADKMASVGADWKTNPITQMTWGFQYIQGRYGNPCSAVDHEFSVNPHWY